MKRKLHTLRMSLLFAFVAISSIGLAQTYTFTSATATGNVGPTQVMVDAEYTGTTLDGAVTVTGGIQTWTVPATGIYLIEAFGGQGYGAFGGRGAHISGEFNLTAGTVLKILVGQRAGDYLNFPATTYNHQFGGGGGSFVTSPTDVPYIVAGGGGGNHAANYLPACDGQTTEAGSIGAQGSILGAGGTAGNGGAQASSADGGGGLLTNGAGIAGGFAFVNGGAGGIDEGTGGFGGGGGTSSWNNYRGGGGGGYSGGGGANNSGTCCAAGGGGGSYNAGANPVNIAGVQTGDGMIIITNQCAPTVGTLVADVANLPDVTEACIVTSLTPPTATNDCVSGLEGTPDVTLPINTVGTTVVTWTYDDGTNSITQTQNIVISGVDTDPPVLDNASLTSLGGQCDFTPPYPTATDVCAGTIVGVADVTFPMSTQGLTTITWTFDDGSGNTVTQTQDITLNDVAPPSPDVANLPTIEGCSAVTPPTAMATDYCNGAINGVPDVTFPITTVGTTTVTWTYDDGNGNVSTQTQDVVLVPTPDVSTSTLGTSITASAFGVDYQWIDCSNGQAIAGETSQSFTATVTGEYAVVITDGSCSDTSACTLIDFTGIDELNSNLIKVYPNPTSNGVFTVDFDGNIDQIIVVDALGRNIELPVDLSAGEVDGSTLVSGKYIVKVITSDAVYTKGIVVLK